MQKPDVPGAAVQKTLPNALSSARLCSSRRAPLNDASHPHQVSHQQLMVSYPIFLPRSRVSFQVSYHTMAGYAKLAFLLGAHPEVAVQNLLYLQAEITALKDDLRAFAAEDDASNDPDRVVHPRDWHTLSMSNDNKHPNTVNIDGNSDIDEAAGKQWQLILAIRAKLKEYSRSANSPSLH